MLKNSLAQCSHIFGGYCMYTSCGSGWSCV